MLFTENTCQTISIETYKAVYLRVIADDCHNYEFAFTVTETTDFIKGATRSKIDFVGCDGQAEPSNELVEYITNYVTANIDSLAEPTIVEAANHE